jgi:putative molybdopterin biosynthesis protein
MPHRPSLGAVRLAYGFSDRLQAGAELDHPLFQVLAAIHAEGSVLHAARVLDRSYRHVWGVIREAEAALGEPLVSGAPGQAARLTDFGGRLLWAERLARARAQTQLETLRSDLAQVVTRARDPSRPVLTICAGHDPALPLLRDHALRHTGLDVALHLQGSVDALRSLNAGRCVVAGLHLPRIPQAWPAFEQALRPLLERCRCRFLPAAHRQQGLLLRDEHAAVVRSLADVARLGLRLVNRPLGSATRLLMDHLVAEAGLDVATLDGYHSRIEESPTAVAAGIAAGIADAGCAVEAAAGPFGLAFVPLVEEDSYLVCHETSLGHPAVQRMRRLLAGDAWRQIVEGFPGYRRCEHAGEALTLAEVMPAWTWGTSSPPPEPKG